MDDLTGMITRTAAQNRETIEAAAAAIVRSGRDGGLLYAAGAGHSLAAVMETFFRAGGLAFVRPLWDPRVLPLAGALASTAAEREPGLGRRVAEDAGLAAQDTVLVISTSGINPYPVEIARHARAAGARVIAMTSTAASAAAPPRAGERLYELADVVLDTAVPPGDVTWPPQNPVTAPASTLLTTALWTAVLRRVDEIWPDAPRWLSANMEGNDEVNSSLVERYAPQIPEL
ncbi:sugar isomerase domain-containing protein [Brachybacterium hainanense]|uniref:Sugar isomerase domain-containing protein n=1 Tax=Brachybacterium hainanense TaxID=1541174 RepID=A0ABV6R9J9_9MICO